MGDTAIRPSKLEETDVAIRVAPSSPHHHDDKSPIDLIMTRAWSGVRSIPFIPDTLIAVCSPALVRKGLPLNKPADLRHYKLLHVATREKAWRYFLQSSGLNPSDFANNASFGHFFMAIQAAIDGNGVALVPRIFIENELKSGLLVPLFKDTGFEAGAYHFLSRTSLWDTSKIVQFREWLAQEAGRQFSTEPIAAIARTAPKARSRR